MTILCTLWLPSTPSWAKKTNQPLYEDPFDIGAGGASLTFASKEGRLFSNPALLPYGGRFHQWAGSTSTVVVNRESVDTAQSLVGGSPNESADGADGTTSGEMDPTLEVLFKTPLRMGVAQALSWITSRGAIAFFSRFEGDARALEYGTNGLPQFEFTAENYQGIVLGTAMRQPVSWLSLGVLAKGLSASEPEVTLDMTDTDSLSQFRSASYWRNLAQPRQGFGIDGGALIFLQGRYVDWKLGASAMDLGNTVLTHGSEEPLTFRQVVSLGTGLTFHTGADAIHLAVDQRDVGRAYGEEAFKRWRLGLRVMLRTHIGFAAGFYDGNPSMGAEVDLILLRVAATVYKRELGDRPGVNTRNMMLLSISAGF